MKRPQCIIVLLAMGLSGCGVFSTNRSNDPQSCRERAAYHIGSVYPDPNALNIAINAICGGT